MKARVVNRRANSWPPLRTTPSLRLLPQGPNTRQKYEHDRAMQEYGMHGGWHTRQRLASASQGDLGRWERVDHLDWGARQHLAALLPPECVATGGKKMRSHRRGLSLYTIQAAINLPTLWLPSRRANFQAILDLPVEEVEAMATLNRLERLVKPR